jgi:hypothetical protein
MERLHQRVSFVKPVKKGLPDEVTCPDTVRASLNLLWLDEAIADSFLPPFQNASTPALDHMSATGQTVGSGSFSDPP